ncbi:unnamed protein product [Orchesella dallaii]|uniref:Beta-Casp domain-containing protein n=1 Tax=Orchesella dallaii TaxID=48710 RepID=A0ABP1S605_9HEXA
MKYYNLGTCSKPCGILKWRGLTIMLDCSLDISTVLNYLPLPLAGNSKFTSAPHFQNYKSSAEGELCELNNVILVDSTPLFGVPYESSIDISEIDVILVSNSSSILALPFFTENPDFHGTVYATEPTVNVGRFFMEELVEFVQAVPKPKAAKSAGKWENVFKQLDPSLNFPCKIGDSCFNRNLKEIYSKKAISDALLRVRIVGFNENTDIFGKVEATAVSSGFSLGSCNWILKSESQKVVYVTSSSTLTTHPSPMEQSSLKDANIFILTGLTRAALHNPDAMMGEICMAVVHTLRNGGNVLFPCYPSGIIYDLFECLTNHLEAHGYGTYPFYFISPHAETSLAYSNILAEWLSNNKQRKVYLPEDPFPHAQLVKDGRLRHCKALNGIPELRQPCVLFGGHPSLRFGDITHLLETWGSNANNSIIFTEAEFPYLECLAPFQPLAMKAFYCPIDTSLNFHQANKLIKDLKPDMLITHEEYLASPRAFPHRVDLVLDYPAVQKLSTGSVINLKLKRSVATAVMDPILASEVEPVVRDESGTIASTITATLDTTNNKYKLVKPSMDLCDPWKCPPSKYAWGSLDSSIVMQKLLQEGFTQAKIQHNATGFIITIPSDNATVTVEPNSTHIVCTGGDGAARLKLRRILISCLTEF